MEQIKKMLEVKEQTKTFKPYLPLKNLQFFNSGEDAGDGGEEQQQEQQQEQNKQGEQKQQTENKQQKQDTKTFTQEDVNNIAAKEAKKATEKLLKSLGVENVDSAKEGLKQFKKMQEEQMTEQEKIAKQNQTLAEENETYKSKVDTLTTQLAVMKAGVKEEAVDDVVVLAKNIVNEETDMDTAIQQVLEKYPHFKNEVEQQKEEKKEQPKFTNGDHKNDQLTETDQWTSAFNFFGKNN